MTISKSFCGIALLTGLFLLPISACAQQVPGPHPALQHALTDLRTARELLDHNTNPAVEAPAYQARTEIDKAIGELKIAAAEDGKNPYQAMPIDAGAPPAGRFRQALALIDRSRHDVSGAEDVPQAAGYRDRAVGHIIAAHNIVDGAIHQLQW